VAALPAPESVEDDVIGGSTGARLVVVTTDSVFDDEPAAVLAEFAALEAFEEFEAFEELEAPAALVLAEGLAASGALDAAVDEEAGAGTAAAIAGADDRGTPTARVAAPLPYPSISQTAEPARITAAATPICTRARVGAYADGLATDGSGVDDLDVAGAGLAGSVASARQSHTKSAAAGPAGCFRCR
jgi:hypothetical protein